MEAIIITELLHVYLRYKLREASPISISSFSAMRYAKLLTCILVSYIPFVFSQDSNVAQVEAAFNNAHVRDNALT
jgi:hypothetical protein